MPRFKKKPVMIEAVQIDKPMTVETLEGTMKGNPGDWLITGIQGEQYFCKDYIFRQTYDAVDEEAEKALRERIWDNVSLPGG